MYDLQEAYRRMTEVAVISSLERRMFKKKDFLPTDNYVIRIKPDAVRRLIKR